MGAETLIRGPFRGRLLLGVVCAQRSWSALLRGLTFDAAMLAATGARTWIFGSALLDVTSRLGAGVGAAKLEAGLLLVEAEAVGDRGCLAATGDPELGQDP
jgi:hypothetical protein